MKIKLDGFDSLTDRRSGFEGDDRFYHISELIQAVKDQKSKPFMACLNSIGCRDRWNKLNVIDFAEHYKRVENCSFDHPIIMNYDGYILDGYHRVTKAIILGKSHIKAVKIDIGLIKDLKI